MEGKLCYIRCIGLEKADLNVYEFYFTDNLDEFWGDDFNVFPSGICNDLVPYENCYHTVKILKTKIKLDVAQESCCYSLQDMIDGVIAVAWENLFQYDEYPSDGRLVFKFGLDYENVEKLLAAKNLTFE